MKLLVLGQAMPWRKVLSTKLLLIMRLTIFFLLAATLNISARGLSQTITLSKKNTSLAKVFSIIQQQSGLSLFYDARLIRQAKNIDIDVKNVSVETALKICLKGQPLTYVITDKLIVIRAASETTATTPIAAQPITGVVRDENGQPVQSASVLLKGLGRGTQTDENGRFTFGNIPAGTYTLVISFVGFARQEKTVTVGDEALNLSIVLKRAEDIVQGAVVVTALGIKRAEKSITYSAQQVNGNELTKVKSSNLINSLNGKVAGLTISSSSSGIGGSAKVILRGPKSLLGSNQALYVIDGVPMNNTITTQPTTPFGGSQSYDGGDPISNLNPDDIESISVLKGASAAALYGSQGANGVIVVTTKSGKAGRTLVNFSSGATFDKVAYKPDFQNAYGQSTGSDQSWGNSITNTTDNLKSYFQTGENFTNSVSLASGSANAQTYFSYANTDARGVQPGNKLSRNNFNFRETGRFFNDKLTTDVNVNYVTQKIDNSPMAGFYFNPLTGLYLFPRGTDISPYKSNYEKLNPLTLLNTQQWIANEDIQQNPWWIVNRNTNTLSRNRILVNGSVKYEFAPWFNIQARGSIDRINDVYEQKLFATTSSVLASPNGGYSYINTVNTQQYGDLLANFNIPVSEKFRITGVAGTSIRDVKTTGSQFFSGNSSDNGLIYPNVFTLQNIQSFNPATSGTVAANHSQWQSVFASVNLAYNEWAYLDLTARNDWSSNLAYTSKDYFFYPSVGLNIILSEIAHLPAFVNFAKVRASYAQVGNAPLAYQSRPTPATIGGGGAISLGNIAPYPSLFAEKTKSMEFGTQWRFLNNRLNLDFTYYKTNTYNQTLQVLSGWASFYANAYLNAGNIQNQGVELILGYDVVRTQHFKWNTGINYAFNKNKVITLAPGVPQASLSGGSSTGANYESRVKEGGSIGDVYGATLSHDAKGRVMIDATGAPIPQTGDFVFLGNANPKWQLGWNNNFTYGNFGLSFLIDGKFGGKVMSVTQALLDQYGVSAASGNARKAGGVKVNGVDPNGAAVSTVDAQKWYTTIGGRQSVSSQYMYDATTVRLRELALGYSIPVKSSVVKNLKVSLVGRNLVYFSKKAPFDPEMTMSTGNGLSGVDVFMPPATRSFGLTLNANF